MNENIPDEFASFWAANQGLLALITDPEGKRYLSPRNPQEKLADMVAQVPRLQGFLAANGNPQSKFRSIHIAGTSGKGSVTAMLASIFKHAGIPSGHHVSPYFQVPNEKLVISGHPIRPSKFVQLTEQFLGRHRNWESLGGAPLKYGEAWVALTLEFFASRLVDWAIIETGMGGRYDPTNVIDSALAIITNISLDHTESLGKTIEEIAWHKAGVIKPGQPIITAETRPEAIEVIEKEARAQQAPIQRMGRDFWFSVADMSRAQLVVDIRLPDKKYRNIHVNLTGKHQAENAALAVAAINTLTEKGEVDIPEDAIREGLTNVILPGRFEIIQESPTVILDGAHNPAKIDALKEILADQFPNRPLITIFGMLSNKDGDAMLASLLPAVTHWILTAPQVYGKLALDQSHLFSKLRALSKGVSAEKAATVQEAILIGLDRAKETDVILITGSIYLVGEARSHWMPVDTLLRQLEEG